MITFGLVPSSMTATTVATTDRTSSTTPIKTSPINTQCVNRIVKTPFGTLKNSDCRCSPVIVRQAGRLATTKWVCPATPSKPSIRNLFSRNFFSLTKPEVAEENVVIVADQTKVPAPGTAVTDPNLSPNNVVEVLPEAIPEIVLTPPSFFQRHRNTIVYGLAAIGSLAVASKLIR